MLSFLNVTLSLFKLDKRSTIWFVRGKEISRFSFELILTVKVWLSSFMYSFTSLYDSDACLLTFLCQLFIFIWNTRGWNKKLVRTTHAADISCLTRWARTFCVFARLLLVFLSLVCERRHSTYYKAAKRTLLLYNYGVHLICSQC